MEIEILKESMKIIGNGVMGNGKYQALTLNM